MSFKKPMVFVALFNCSLLSMAHAEPSRDLSEKVSIFLSPIAYLAARPNLGIRFPIADLQWPMPLTVSLGLKATFYSNGDQTESTLGCESCSAPSWRTKGFEVGPQLYFSTRGMKFGIIKSFDLRLATYLTQSTNLSSSQDPNDSAQDSIKGVSFEAMTFANMALGDRLFANVGTGLISEPHLSHGVTYWDSSNEPQKEHEIAAVIEFNVGLAFPE